MDNSLFDADLTGIASLIRSHIEIRNRSWMKRVHRDCFIGSDAVSFLVIQGLADTRKDAVEICRRMMDKKLIRHVTDGHKFRDAYFYYIFAEDDRDDAILASTNGGNGEGVHYGKGGCKFSFAPHTVHNSYIMDVSLADEIERGVAGASVESRHRAIMKLRQRVREQASVNAPDWDLIDSTEINHSIVNVYKRKRPRGEFENIKVTGTAAESPKDFIRGIMGFERRKVWETNFEDGVIVEAIDINESCALFAEDANDLEFETLLTPQTPALPDGLKAPSTPLARKTDDVYTFLQTVDLAGIPAGMPIAFLNDPERQHALSHLRKQMMMANPEECMVCSTPFNGAGEWRFCPCCATIACANCTSKRVFEVVSRQVVSVCVHCYRESSRIRQPPQAVKDASNIDEALRGKWWRPEELGLADYSHGKEYGGRKDSSQMHAPSVEEDMKDSSLVTRIFDEDTANEAHAVFEAEGEVGGAESMHTVGLVSTDVPDAPEDIGMPYEEEDAPKPPSVDKTRVGSTMVGADEKKYAKCKTCGEWILRDVEAIDKHMEECSGERGGRDGSTDHHSAFTPKAVAGILRKPELEKCGTRIIYHTSRSAGTAHRPREVCTLQDGFVDPDGTCYTYEVSVRHCDVRGIAGYVTADVLLLLHVARPIKGKKGMSNISIISQVDARSNAPKWLRSLLDRTGTHIGAHREDIIREMKASGNLKNILDPNDADPDAGKVSLTDFDLLAVLGRGGFGKVMQVRHRQTNVIYAMKILKKSELQRRRQVERTRTERTILAAVQHPFIVCLHYAFQNAQKLYMVMDFVQGGDFFTLMRKYKRLPEDWVRFYVCEISMALQHLHDMDIVYRDLKPENLLLCSDGHLKLTDFGLSRYFETRPPAAEDMITADDAVTRSFCGTEQYMSPEMLLQQGHNWRMDWWCLGLLMHEMISARHPFHGPSHYDTLRNMVTKQPTIDPRVSPLAVTVVRGLLIKNPRARLCCRSGLEEMKALPFFNNIDWQALYNRNVPVPYIPTLADGADTSSFETTFTREAPVDSVADNPTLGTKKKGLLGLLGIGAGAPKTDVDAPFAGFSYAKEELGDDDGNNA